MSWFNSNKSRQEKVDAITTSMSEKGYTLKWYGVRNFCISIAADIIKDGFSHWYLFPISFFDAVSAEDHVKEMNYRHWSEKEQYEEKQKDIRRKQWVDEQMAISACTPTTPDASGIGYLTLSNGKTISVYVGNEGTK
jgi:hypothetical protein